MGKIQTETLENHVEHKGFPNLLGLGGFSPTNPGDGQATLGSPFEKPRMASLTLGERYRWLWQPQVIHRSDRFASPGLDVTPPRFRKRPCFFEYFLAV